MRYEPAERMLKLARHLAATRLGLTLDEMVAATGMTRRTVERMRDALAELFPQLDCRDDGRSRRWRLPGPVLAALAPPPADAVAAVEAAAREAEAGGNAARAGSLREAALALRAAMPPAALRKAEVDIEALMQAEGIAMRPGPRVSVAPGVLPALRTAILGMRQVGIVYARPDPERPAWRQLLCPYGLLHGGRGWLVAHVAGLPEMRLWRLDRILEAVPAEDGFARREDFSLAEYASGSFGVFQEDPVEVVLRFAPDAAADAARWRFHPTQRLAPRPDGGLAVRFTAGGLREMCWHLFTWGDAVTIEAPDTLREMMRDMLRTARKHHDRF